MSARNSQQIQKKKNMLCHCALLIQGISTLKAIQHSKNIHKHFLTFLEADIESGGNKVTIPLVPICRGAMFYSVISCAVSWNIAGGGKGNGGRGEQCRYQDRSCDGRTEFLSYSTQEKCSLLFCCQKCHSKQHIVNKPVMQLCCPWQQYAARFYIRRKLYAMS